MYLLHSKLGKSKINKKQEREKYTLLQLCFKEILLFMIRKQKDHNHPTSVYSCLVCLDTTGQGARMFGCKLYTVNLAKDQNMVHHDSDLS